MLKTAVDAFERDLTPWIIEDACASHAGLEPYSAGLLVARRFIGRSQVITAADLPATPALENPRRSDQAVWVTGNTGIELACRNPASPAPADAGSFIDRCPRRWSRMTEASGASTTTGTELSVRTESVQRLYLLYGADRFRVNRRYQRKLVWSVEEKQKLIDSVLKDLPMPLFLVAEIGFGADASFELIDGMQRLNALFAFLENEFAVGAEYFDLDSLADTKYLKDDGQLVQREPVMSRPKSVQVVNYAVALSVFRAPNSNSIDEVFRRINSGGRRLSRQELRQAGTISFLADLVRVISSRVRGDTSPDDVIPLKVMPRLSITNRDLDYGVLVDDIFWVRQGILRREDVRTSLDEQLILDILIDCLIDPLPSTGTETRDGYYNFSADEESTAATRLASQIRLSIESYGRDAVERDFMRVYDEIRDILQ